MTMFGAAITEAGYLRGLLAICFVPYLFHIASIRLSEAWRKLLISSVVFFSHALAVIGYMLVIDRIGNIHRGDAGLGDAFLVMLCVGFNLLASLVTAILSCIKDKRVLLWLGVQVCAIGFLLLWIFK